MSADQTLSPRPGTARRVAFSLLAVACRLLPPKCQGLLEYHMRPHLSDGWGGPFNGQSFRQLVFADLWNECRFEAIVETGTFCGSTTAFMANNANIRVYSSELNPRYFAYASKRLQTIPNVRLVHQDSRRFLKSLELARDLRLFFYLDAHGNDDLPLREEIEYIIRSFSSFVAMIDDFEVPNDPGYAFDDYGIGKCLSLRDFPFHQDKRVSVYFPNRPSQAETGARRGCIVLASPSLALHVSKIGSLYSPVLQDVLPSHNA